MNHATELAAHRHYDPIGARVGMWLFLFTELLLFGGLFLLYAIYLNKNPEDFRFASSQLDQFVGAMNTIILLTSSLTMALSIGALQRNKRKLAITFLVVTFLLGAVFLVNKYFEWGHKIELGIYPNSPELLKHPSGEILFYGLYYVMTGLHGLHVLVGMIIMVFLVKMVTKTSHRVFSLNPNSLEKFVGKRLLLRDEKGNKIWESETITPEIRELNIEMEGRYTEEDNRFNVIKFENAGLYWHLVDIIWIFLFPLFYLISM
ncbi:MAG: cytochrome c oxidase subunit 3 family protein [Calditrichia bacterium]